MFRLIIPIAALVVTHEVTNNCTTTINYNDTIETVDEAYVTYYVVITKLFTLLADDRYAIIL